MNLLKKMFSRAGLFKELLEFMWENKLWWLIPFVFFLVLIGIILIASQGSVIAPFIYTLF